MCNVKFYNLNIYLFYLYYRVDNDNGPFDFFSGLSLGFRRKRCNKLLQLSDNNCVTLAVELRVYRWRRGAVDDGALTVDVPYDALLLSCEDEDAMLHNKLSIFYIYTHEIFLFAFIFFLIRTIASIQRPLDLRDRKKNLHAKNIILSRFFFLLMVLLQI